MICPSTGAAWQRFLVWMPIITFSFACGPDGLEAETPDVSRARFDQALMQLNATSCHSGVPVDSAELDTELGTSFSLLQKYLQRRSVNLITSGYQPKGSQMEIGGIKSYVVGNGTKAVVMIEDLPGIRETTDFGLNMKQDADVLAESGGYLVVLPDWISGHEATVEPEYLRQITPHVVESVRSDILPALKTLGVSEWSAFGFCWGGAVAIQLGGFDGPDAPKAIATTHPYLAFGADINFTDAAKLKSPALLMPSQDDIAAVGTFLASKQFQNNSFALKNTKVIEFKDVHHGYCAGMVEWDKDPLSAQRCAEALEDTLHFFADNTVALDRAAYGAANSRAPHLIFSVFVSLIWLLC